MSTEMSRKDEGRERRYIFDIAPIFLALLLALSILYLDRRFGGHKTFWSKIIMLYIFSDGTKLLVSDLNPDETDYETVLLNSVEVSLPNPGKIPLDTQAGVVRNVLANGGAPTTIL